MPFSSCSCPMEICTATQRSSCDWSCSSAAKKSARSRSSMVTKRTRQRSSFSARSQARRLDLDAVDAVDVINAPSTTRAEAAMSPSKPGSPGVSTRLILRSCHSRWQSDAARDICRRCSSSSQSETVVELRRTRGGWWHPPGRASLRPAKSSVPWCPTGGVPDLAPAPRAARTASLPSWSLRAGKNARAGPPSLGSRARARRRGAPSCGGSPSCGAGRPTTRSPAPRQDLRRVSSS